MKNVFFLILGFIFAAHAIVPDPALERRLERETIYITKGSDSWEIIASKVYGHSTWGPRLQKMNPRYRHFNILPEGTEIKYRAPKVGESYVVKPNDTFLRIVEWKYGGTKLWNKIIKKYYKQFDTIRAGDRFTFDLRGNITLIRGNSVSTQAARAPKIHLSTQFVDKIYRTNDADSIRRIAYRVYGHRSWWPKLKEDNPHLQQYRPNQLLPENIKIAYKGPNIGQEYEVKWGDTLSRIAIWKYGDMDLWKKIAEKNKDILDSPDLIHVGDKLILGARGGIQVVEKKVPQVQKILTKDLIEQPVIDPPKEVIAQVKPPVVKTPGRFSIFLGEAWRFIAKYLPITLLAIVVITVIVLLVMLIIKGIQRRAEAADRAFITEFKASNRPMAANGEMIHFDKSLLTISEDNSPKRHDYPSIIKTLYQKLGRIVKIGRK